MVAIVFRFLAWLIKVAGIKKSQVIYTSGESYAMDDDMNAEVSVRNRLPM